MGAWRARWPSSPAGDRESAWPRASRLAEAGVSVAVVDLDGASAERAAADLGGLGLQADVGRSEDVAGHRRGGHRPVRRHRPGPPERRGDDRRGRHHQGHRRDLPPGRRGQRRRGRLRGPGRWCPALSARGGGAIVATASLAGLIGFSPDPIYCLTKHAVVGLVRSLGPQLAEHNITINAVCPSIVDTPLIDDMREVLEGSGFPLIDAAAVSRRWSTGWPARRPARPWSSRPGGRPLPSGSPGLPVPGPAGRSGRCRPDRVRRPRSGLRRAPRS